MAMPLAVLEVPVEVAKERLQGLRELLRVERRVENERLAAGFREIARGRQVISLTQTIAAGGLDELGRPKLAICRADARHCYLRMDQGAVGFVADEERTWRVMGSALVGQRYCRVPVESAPHRSETFVATVPNVPAEHRPRVGRGVYKNLGKFHILWEAQWQAAPRASDPALLRHLGGDLFSVLAVWDLTPLEAAVLAGRTP